MTETKEADGARRKSAFGGQKEAGRRIISGS